MLEIGSLVEGKYKILNVIGEGGMSTVYLAMNERANKQWAIKEVRKNGVSDYRVVRQSLIVETDMLKRLSHPYLPSIVDVIDHDDAFLIVMDYIEGNPLSKAVEEYGAQPQEYVIEWAKQLCGVLEYLHTRTPAIIYRDLKPGNIMLRPDGTITLIDFGTAREFKDYKQEDTTYLGTRGYAAPEQFGGRGQTDARTDVYCLGTTLYHLVTGHNPCEPPYELYPIRYWNERLSTGLEQIIAKCVQNNPQDRYSSCAEILYDLEHYQELDSSVHKAAGIKVGIFSLACVMTVGCFGGAWQFHTKAGTFEAEGYDSLLLNAKAEENEETQIDTYNEAIRLDPANESAYLNLLENVYLADENLTQEEDEELRSILITSYDGEHTCEDILRKDEKSYADFAYRLGIAYYYCYNETGNKAMASKWLTLASQSGQLSENQLERAKRLGQIASYYENLGKESKSGDSKVSYRQYWDDLVAASEGDIASLDNETTALIIYKELASQIYINVNKFHKDGVTQDEMKTQLDNIESHLKSDFTQKDAANAERIGELTREVTNNVNSARESVRLEFDS